MLNRLGGNTIHGRFGNFKREFLLQTLVTSEVEMVRFFKHIKRNKMIAIHYTTTAKKHYWTAKRIVFAALIVWGFTVCAALLALAVKLF